MLSAILTADIFAIFLLFARVGSAFVMLPTIGENFFPTRTRLLFAVLVSLVSAPILAQNLPAMPTQLGVMIEMVAIEIFYGIFIGTAAKVMFNALSMFGTFISMFTGLSSAMLFNPAIGEQGSFYSVFFSLLGTALFFASDMHHLLIRAVLESYFYFLPGRLPPMGDFADSMARIAADAFKLGFELSAPFIVITSLLYLLLGVMSRVMPQLQVFFVALPVQILLGYVIVITALSGIMIWFLDRYEDFISQFIS